MINNLPPGSLFLIGAAILPLLSAGARPSWMLGTAVFSLLHLLQFPADHLVQLDWFNYTLQPIRIDRLSLVWGYVFHLAAILASIYAWHWPDRLQRVAAMSYVGASIGAVFAGDLLTLFVYWELTALTSVVLVWAGPGRTAYSAGMRYLLVHIASGVLVLSGAILLLNEHGSLQFGEANQWGYLAEMLGPGAWALLLGFGIKAAFPLLHCWLPDAYPEATPAGTVFLSAFTTKMAIYALARGFAGYEPLIAVGAVMALLPLVHALLADDLRRCLAHVLNNQLGFMVVAIGVGTPLAISGAAAQAFAHVIYKGLLFMALGAVLYRTGTAKQSQLGMLWRTMPRTCICCLVGALSVLPLNCGFVTKALVLKAVADAHQDWAWLILVLGAAGAFLAAGFKVCYFPFFAPATSERPAEAEEAPLHMQIAMFASAAICLLIGCFPGLLYNILPTDLHDVHVYDFPHVTTQLQLLSFTAIAAALAVRWGLYPQPVTGTLLDVDWLYRRPLRQLAGWALRCIEQIRWDWLAARATALANQLSRQSSEAGILGRTVSTNAMGISAMILLAIYLFAYFR